VGDQAPRRNQRRMNAQLDALRDAAPRPARDAEELDAVAELLGVADVRLGQLLNALPEAFIELHRYAERERGKDRQLVRGVDALDVEGGIRLGVAAPLRVLERSLERQALVAHLREDEVGGAVDDPGDPFDAVR